ncbi:MAG: hypothetical protein ACOH1I_08475 [Gallionellaceae bacterium]|jgi:hypothetical protein
MQVTAEILGKKILIEWTESAEQAMAALATPLVIEMELYFSCLIRKAVRFNAKGELPHAVAVTPKMTVGFRPVVTKACSVSDIGDDEEPPVEDFKLTKPEAFVPKKLFVDFKRGQWLGKFQMSNSV